MRAKIKLAFRITIDSNSKNIWDQYVFEEAYREYRIQHQVYQSKEQPALYYWELLSQNPNANKIPFIVASSIQSYVDQLNGEIKSLPDVLGSTFFKFKNYKVDIVSAHFTDITKFKIGITFFSIPFLLIDIIDQKYLLSENTYAEKGVFSTFMLAFHQQVSICEYEIIG